jgi:salicylate hydroxylase
VYPDYHGPEIPTLVAGDGRVVFIGDAAHPHGGAFAAGGTCSVEDAYTVMRAVDHVQQKAQVGRLSREELADAFDIYNECRYAHTLRVMKAAEAVRAERRANAGRRLSDEEIKENAMKRGYFNWLALNDTEGVFQKVVAARGSLQSRCTII